MYIGIKICLTWDVENPILVAMTDARFDSLHKTSRKMLSQCSNGVHLSVLAFPAGA